MIDNYFPIQFSSFRVVAETIHNFHPINISIVGSFGDQNKIPNDQSDFDVIYVFRTTNIYSVNDKINSQLKKIKKLKILELGVHFQFGFLYSLYFEDNPMRWIDIGIMDLNFAINYLVDLPKKDVYGSFRTSGIKEIPKNHLNQLGRKIIKYLNNGQHLQAQIVSYRYLNWLNVENKINKIRNNNIDIEFERIYGNQIKLTEKEILDYVLKIIEKKDFEIIENLKIN